MDDTSVQGFFVDPNKTSGFFLMPGQTGRLGHACLAELLPETSIIDKTEGLPEKVF